MVEITVFFEGGANPAGNPNAATIDNTTRLREAFNTLLNSGINNKNIRIIASSCIFHIQRSKTKIAK